MTAASVSRRSVIVGAAAMMTAGAAYALAPRRAEHRLLKTKLGDLIPTQVGPWKYHGENQVIVARAEDALKADTYDQVVGRIYEAPGRPTMMLLVAYGSTQGSTLQLHRPETCYPGQGFALSGFSDPDLSFVPDAPVHSRRFTATRDDRVERLIYWTRIAESFPRNTAQEYRAILGSVLRGTVPDGVLVRVSTLVEDQVAADRAIDQFTALLVKQSPAAGRQILVGNAIASEIPGGA